MTPTQVWDLVAQLISDQKDENLDRGYVDLIKRSILCNLSDSQNAHCTGMLL